MPIEDTVDLTPPNEEKATNSESFDQDTDQALELANSAAASRRLFDNGGDITHNEFTTETGTNVIKPTERVFRNRRRVAAAALGVAGGALLAPVVPQAIEAVTAEKQPTEIIDITVMSGDGLQKIMETYDEEVKAGKQDYRDAIEDLRNIPANDYLFQPGYILQAGDTVSIEVPKQSPTQDIQE